MLSVLYAIYIIARPSVTQVYHRKMVEVRIMKFSPYSMVAPSL